MAGYIKGITIEFSANVEKLNKALGNVQGRLNKTQSELRQVNKALKFNPGNTTLLNQKFTLLQKNVKDTTKKLDGLRAMQARMDKNNVDKNTEAYRQLEREIIKTEDQLKQAEKELKSFGTVGKQQALAVGQAFKDAGAKISSAGRSMTTSVTVPLVAGFTASAKLASDYEENLNKIDVAFGKSADTVKEWALNANKQFGLSRVQATNAASAFGALGKGIGLSEGDAASMATTLAGLSADLGSYFNVGIDESAKALEGIFTGESEALKKFGVVMTETNLKKFAEDQGLVWSEMSQGEKTALRYQYVLDKTKDAQGDFARTSEGTANSTKIFKAAIEDLGTNIGTALLPIITPIIQKISDIIGKFNELSPTAQKIITIVGLIVAAIGPVLLIVGAFASAIGNIISIATVLGPILAGVSLPMLGIAAAIAAAIAIGVLLYKNWDTIKAKASALFNSVKTTFGKIKTAITKPFTDAWGKVKAVFDKLKGLFPLKIGKLFSGMKLPHFSVKGKAPFGIGGKGVKPGISVKWYDKAMDNPYMFSNATLFGAGETGDEMLYGRQALMRDIAEASGGGMNYAALATAIVDALTGVDASIILNVDGRKVADTTAPYMNTAINQLQARQNRQLGFV